jgi:hypothetical protein
MLSVVSAIARSPASRLTVGASFNSKGLNSNRLVEMLG